MIPKFRAWSKKEKRMFLVGEIDFEVNEIRENITRFGHEFNEIQLMQSTGIKDVNGKEIFEGDILKLDHNRISVVEYDVPLTKFMLKRIRPWSICSFDGHSLGAFMQFCDVEIIGNIHENPELLEEIR